MSNVQPIIVTQLGQVLIEDYGVPSQKAFKQAIQLCERLEARGMQIIKGEWLIPEDVVVVRHEPPPETDRWMALANKVTRETAERQPWNSVELK